MEQSTNLEAAAPKNKKSGIIAALLAVIIVLVGGGIAAYFMFFAPQNISTGNARITTELVPIVSLAPGRLENFDLYEGQLVEAGDILGLVIVGVETVTHEEENEDGEVIFRTEELEHSEDLVAPFDGMIVSTFSADGRYISPMEPLAIIADTANIRIQANIYETDIRDVYVGQRATITLDVFGNRTFRGTVTNISRLTELELIGAPPQVITGSGTFRRVTHTFPVEITITEEVDLSRYLGSNARIRLPINND